jgi:cytoskeletal protein RodZ
MSFGEELKRERELRRISLREVAQATKIRLRYLEAMERNDFTCLPGGLFNRGFVRAYCKHIGIDPEAMVNAYLLEERARDGSAGDRGRDGLLRGGTVRPGVAPGAAGEAKPRGSLLRRRGRLLALLLAALVVAAGAILVWLAVDARRSDTANAAPSGAGPTDEMGTGRRSGEEHS